MTGEVAPPVAAEHNYFIPFQPGDKEVVSLNPPVFTWQFSPVAGTNYYRQGDYRNKEENHPWRFRFQAAYDSSFLSPVVDLVTPWNVFNAFAPFSSNTVYWRVGYISTTNSTVASWSRTRSFTIAPSPTLWDRTVLTNRVTLTNRMQHPHLLFTAATLPGLSNWLGTNLASRTQWDSVRGTAIWYYTNRSYFDLDYTNFFFDPRYPQYVQNGTNNFNSYGFNGWCFYLQYVMYVAKVWSNTWLPELPAKLDIIARHYKNTTYWYGDETAVGTSPASALAYGYDWLYDRLTPAQRSNVLDAMERRFWAGLRGGYVSWWAEPTDWGGHLTNYHAYTGGYRVHMGSAAKNGGSHPAANVQNILFMAMSAWNDSPYAQEAFEVAANFLVGVGYQYSRGGVPSQGHHYSQFYFLNNVAPQFLTLQQVLPELQLGKSPFLAQHLDYWMHALPNGFVELVNPTGDVNNMWSLRTPEWLNLARITGNGQALQYHQRNIGRVPNESFSTIGLGYYFKDPVPQTKPELDRFFPEGGFVSANSRPVNNHDSFTNAVGFSFYARPYGGDTFHCHPHDLDVQMWAYGAMLTDGGDSYSSYGHHPMSRNIVLVNGYGPLPTIYAPKYDYASRILRFTNGTDYAYAAGDATRAYPIDNRIGEIGGTSLLPLAGALYPKAWTNANVGSLNKMVRHVLFPRRKFLVLYDDMEATKPLSYQWTWHVPYLWRSVYGPRYEILPKQSNEFYYVNGNLSLYASNSFSMNSNDRGFTYTAGGWYPSQGNTLNQALTNRVKVVVRHVAYTNLLTPIARRGLPDWTGTNSPYTFKSECWTNLWTGEDFSPLDCHGEWNKSALVWMKSPPATNWHFMTVVYPVIPGEPDPIIVPIDDFTVAVTNGLRTEGDVITFNKNYGGRAGPATHTVDPGGTGGGTFTMPPPPTTPRNPRFTTNQ